VKNSYVYKRLPEGSIEKTHGDNWGSPQRRRQESQDPVSNLFHLRDPNRKRKKARFQAILSTDID